MGCYSDFGVSNYVEQFIKCLLSLYNMYRLIGKGKGISDNEAEFYSLYVLLHLGNSLPNMVCPCPVLCYPTKILDLVQL